MANNLHQRQRALAQNLLGNRDVYDFMHPEKRAASTPLAAPRLNPPSGAAERSRLNSLHPS